VTRVSDDKLRAARRGGATGASTTGRWRGGLAFAGKRGCAGGFVSLVALACLGCSRTIHLRQPLSSSDIQSVNEEVHDDDVDVTLRTDDGAKETRDVTVLSVSTTRVKWQGDAVRTASLLQVHAVDRGAGLAEGASIGALSGVLLGAGIGWATLHNNSGGFITFSPGDAALVGALVFLIPGVLIGTLVGGVVGDRTTFVFDESPAPP
jgi:hypothetical protein